MSAQEKNFASRALTLMREGPFRRYIIGSAISDTGTWMQVMAQGWVMSSLTNQALMLGMVNFAAGIPTLLITFDDGFQNNLTLASPILREFGLLWAIDSG